MIELTLSNSSLKALIDDEDYSIVVNHTWHLIMHDNCAYARTGVWVPESNRSKGVRMHRMILPSIPRLDHKDGNGLNNQKDNLRPFSKGQNSMNARLRKDSTSGFKGVTWRKDTSCWTSHIVFQRKTIALGCYKDIVDAAKAYDTAAIELFGEFARVNFPLEVAA